MRNHAAQRAPSLLLLALLAALAAAGCARGDQGSAPPPELVVALEGAPKNLDPRVAQDAYSTRLLVLVFEGLTRVGPTAEPEPALAASWDIQDELTYRFRLQPGRRFSDGHELTAQDVVATLLSLGDPKLASPSRYLFDLFAEVSAPSDLEVLIILKKPFSPLLSALNIGIVPAEAAEADPQADAPAPPIIGSGPYLIAQAKANEQVTLQPNPHFHGPRPPIETIVFKVIEDDVTRLLALERGEVHLIQNAVPPDDLPSLQKDPRLAIATQPGINYAYIGLNLEDPILKNLAVRKAIASALDRETISRCLLHDSVSPATGILAPGHWAYNPNVATYPHDPELAMRLLDQAGYPDPDGLGPKTRFNLIYKTSQNKLRRWIAEAIADQLKSVGVGVEVRALEFGTFYDDIRQGRFQIYSLIWPGPTEPDIYYSVFNSQSFPPNGANRNRYVNPDVDRLTQQGRAVANRDQRAQIYRQVQAIVAADLPYISLWHEKNTAATDARLHGFRFYPGGDYRSLAEARWE